MKNRAIQPSPIVKNRKISPERESKPSTATKSEGYHKKCTQEPWAAEKQRVTSAQLKLPSKPLQTPSNSTSAQSKPASKPLKTPVTPSSAQSKPASKPPKTPATPPSAQSKPASKPIQTTTYSKNTPQVGSVKPTQQKPTPLPSQPISSSANQARSSSATSKSLSTVLTASKKHSELPKPSPPSRQEVSLSRGDLKEIATRFEDVSSSVLQVATSRRPVTARSLEALLNLEISKSLGDSVNEPAFAQGFVKATRRLLEELVKLYEGGKLNPKLLWEGGRKKKTFIRANSSITVCYRDRYFKELVMNVLQSMTSNEIEEEIMSKVQHSAESRERIQIIRDMVRTEAGLDPEHFKELEKRLEELRRSLSISKLEMEKAASEVDQIINQHSGMQERVPSSLEIPTPARDVLRSCYKRLESGSDVGEGGACKSKKGCGECTSYSTNVGENGSEKYKKSLDIIGQKEFFEKGNSDEIQNIRPQLKNLVHEELLNIKMKEEEILAQDREFDRNNRLADTPRSSFESVEFKSAASNFSAEDEDEIGEEETRTFLEVLKAEIEEHKLTNDELLNCGPLGVCIRVLETIDEENEKSNRERVEQSVIPTSSQREILSSSLSVSKTELEPHKSDEENLSGTNQYSTDTLENQPSEQNVIERVKSKLLYQEPSDVNNVLVEMKDTFETINKLSYVLNDFEINEDSKKETQDINNESKFKDHDFRLWDFTVGEVANVMVKISFKINDFPEYLQEIASNPEQKKQALHILSVLEKCVNASNPTEHDITDVSDEASLPIEKYAKTFSFLSSSLTRSPRAMQSESISVLNPPKSLVDTLQTLSSTAYFRDCFMSVRDNTDKETEKTKNIEVVKPYNINENISSGGMLNQNLMKKLSSEDKFSEFRKNLLFFPRDFKRSDDVNKNLGKYEHFMGLTASTMTVQNVSDMFLFLSTVLNDVPERLKSEKILDLDPPLSLLNVLNILYNEEDEESMTDLEKKTSLGSLSLQNVSDFLLTLSKTFDDIPERLKESIVTDLKPPQSLLRAIALLTSLTHLSIPENSNEGILEDIQEENLSSDNPENYFDAVASLGSMN